ncbi:MAG: rod shape-determining protein MreD [Actinobacteria bacterium]|nr:rod shape-determining protein MreD [Actinomycetota bacterium]
MTAARTAGALLAVCVAVLLQATVISRLPLPGGTPSLVLLLVIAIGFSAGTTAGLFAGFVAGATVDLMSDHPLGVAAICLALGGFVAGTLLDNGTRGVARSLLLVVTIAGVVQLLYAALLALLGARGGSVLHGLAGAVGYDALLAPLVLPVVAAVERRLRSVR